MTNTTCTTLISRSTSTPQVKSIIAKRRAAVAAGLRRPRTRYRRRGAWSRQCRPSRKACRRQLRRHRRRPRVATIRRQCHRLVRIGWYFKGERGVIEKESKGENKRSSSKTRIYSIGKSVNPLTNIEIPLTYIQKYIVTYGHDRQRIFDPNQIN